jgi:hypothetical protein
MSIGEISSVFFTNPGLGGVVAIIVFLAASAIYYGLTRWIINGSTEKKRDLFR